MNSAAFILMLPAACCLAAAPEQAAWHDLHLQAESFSEPIVVNGLPLAVSRFTGSDVGVLAKRLGDKWLEYGGVRSATQGNWMIMSRLHDAGLEVVQWRGTGTDAELLWSRSDLPAKIQLPTHRKLPFPTGCVPGRTVSGRIDTRTYSQQSARCKGSPRNTLSTVKAGAIRQGYAVQSRDGQLVARNRTSEVTVLAFRSNDGSARATALLYLQLDPLGPGQ